MEIRTADVVQYLQPLREGGSLPAIVKADDGALYVLKFRGAGQGRKALIADLIGGELARTIGLKVPGMIFMNLDDSFSKTEPDEEIQDLLKFSVGLNLGVRFLSGAITYDPLVFEVDAVDASKIILLDSLIINIDRTVRNTNMLDWRGELWLIDHGASLYFHHDWDNWENYLSRPFRGVKDHVLLGKAVALEEASRRIEKLVTPEKLVEIVAAVPDDWLEEAIDDIDAAEKRRRYVKYLSDRFNNLAATVKHISDVQQIHI